MKIVLTHWNLNKITDILQIFLHFPVFWFKSHWGLSRFYLAPEMWKAVIWINDGTVVIIIWRLLMNTHSMSMFMKYLQTSETITVSQSDSFIASVVNVTGGFPKQILSNAESIFRSIFPLEESITYINWNAPFFKLTTWNIPFILRGHSNILC